MYIIHQIRRECSTVINRTKLYRSLGGHEHDDTFTAIDAVLNQQQPDLSVATNAVVQATATMISHANQCVSAIENIADLILYDDNAIASADLPDFTSARSYFEHINGNGQSPYFTYPHDDDTVLGYSSPHTALFAAAYSTARGAAQYASDTQQIVLENASKANAYARANNTSLAYDQVLQTLVIAIRVAQAAMDTAEATCAAAAYAAGYADYARNAARPEYQVAALDAAFNIERDAVIPAIRAAAYANALAYTVAKAVDAIAQSAQT